mmetsp:Transcript_2358/g.3782  ORF Transcript_2358/g.3782 Transcript_2358/m.3782 type:complete len:326 (-) Transcript_2358:243-1220(-)
MAAHNDRFWIEAADSHGHLASTTHCPRQDATCLFVSTHDRCSRLDYKNYTPDEVHAAASRLSCAHPYVAYGELHHLHYEPNEWFQEQIDTLRSLIGGEADIGIHVRRGDRVGYAWGPWEHMRMPSNEHIARMLHRIAAAPEHHGALRNVWLMSDDPQAADSIATALDSTAPELNLTFFDFGSETRLTCTRRNLCNAVLHSELGAFLLAGFMLIATGRVVISNSNSNLGILVASYAETYSRFPATPILVDMDLRATNAVLEERKWVCRPEWGSRTGLCPAGVAGDCWPAGNTSQNGRWHAPESAPDNSVEPAPCTPSMVYTLTCPA